jgi:mRNA interferase YafQ
MLKIKPSTSFEKDIKRIAARGRSLVKMFLPIAILLNNHPLPPDYHDHPLKGEWAGWRDFHVETDWVVIYKIEDGCLHMMRTGTHSDILGD